MNDEYQMKNSFESKVKGMVFIGGGRINQLEMHDEKGEVKDMGRGLLMLRNLVEEELVRYEKSDERRK